MSAPAERVVKDMGVSHADFWRTIPRVLDGYDWRREGEEGLVADGGGGRVTIRLGPEGRRRIAMFEVPTTRVTIAFHGLDAAARQAFIASFDRRFQRGGG